VAKVFYSALVDTIRGSMKKGSVMSAWKGIQYMKTHAWPRQPRTAVQQRVRGIISELAGDWYSMTEGQKELWNKYASLLKNPMTGLNAYVHTNLRLYKYLGAGSMIDYPPPSPATPDAPAGLSASAAGAGTFQISWTAPTATNQIVIVEKSPLAGLDDRARPRFAVAGTAGADAGLISISHTYPSGTVVRFRVRSMDLYGRISPPSEIIEATAA